MPPDYLYSFGGIPGDIPITGDWTGNGFTKIGIYRPSNGLFILDTNGNGQLDAGDAVFNLQIGKMAGDVPVVGDWNGDGRSKVGYFRQGFLWILDTNGNHVFEQGIDQVFSFGGVAGDVPVVGDWTGTGISKIGVFRQGFLWALDANGNGTLDPSDPVFPYGGVTGDVPVVGDWAGTGVSQVGVFRQGFLWALDANGDRQIDSGDYVFGYGGVMGDVPVVGRWSATIPQVLPTTFSQCLLGSAGRCILKPGLYAVSQQLDIGRSNVVLGGPDGALSSQTKLVRAAGSSPGYTAPIISVGANATSPLTGITIQNLTICGSSTLTPGASPVGCPRVATACGNTLNCVDLEIDNVDAGTYPANPFGYNGPYSLVIANVDLEDATGHAMDLNAANTAGKKNNDIYIHNSSINFSGVTGILGLTDYPDKYCDGYAANNGGTAFADAQSLPAPRNIRIEYNMFNSNNTGAMGGGTHRWLGLRHNTFMNNYTNPQAGNTEGGTVQLVGCSDTVEISSNTFTGPSYPLTDALELYGRNMNIHDNGSSCIGQSGTCGISGYGFEGVGAHSLYNSTITANYVHDNSRNATTGGIKAVTSFGTGGCDGVPRDENIITITGNTSSNQPYGIYFADQGQPSSDTLHNITVSGNYLTQSTIDQLATDLTVELNTYVGPPFAQLNSLPDTTLYALGANSISWEYPLCPSQPGVSLAPQEMTFTIPAKDDHGTGNVTWVEGMFSVSGSDSDGSGGPDNGAQGCHFHWDTASQLLYLAPGSGGYNWLLPPSPLGNGATQDLSNGICTIHTRTSSVSTASSNPAPYVLTLTMDITFPRSSKYHFYTVTENNQGDFSNGDSWSYWGWWATQ